MRLPRATLASRILVAVLAIVALTMATGLALYVTVTRDSVDAQAEERALNIAESVGDMPQIASELAAGDPGQRIRRLAAQVVHDTGASYVVVIDRTGKRYSHPNPAMIGRRVEEPVVALDGHTHIGTNNGSLGRSANAKAPVRDAAGAPVGEVSVGILETEVAARLRHAIGALVLYTAFALALGVAASLVLARTIKRVTFGLEPAEIVALVQEREAMLHGIREGVIGFDAQGRMNVLNDEARRLLGVPGARLGQRVTELLPPGRVRDVVSGAAVGPDQVAVTDDHLLVLNRMPVNVAGRDAGWVVTIRDRTELEALVRQLDSVEALTTALRAQEHEFANRLHVLSTLLELGEVQEATQYAGQVSAESALVAETVRSRIGSPVVSALLLAKMTVAAERGVDLVLTPGSRLSGGRRHDGPLLAVLGNLVDNAIDAVSEAAVAHTGAALAGSGSAGNGAAGSGAAVAGGDAAGAAHPRGRVTVELRELGPEVHLVVSDTGPGIPPERVEEVFVDGYTTKDARGPWRRGLGLALVHRLVSRTGGTIRVTSPAAGGARFEVRMVPPVDGTVA